MNFFSFFLQQQQRGTYVKGWILLWLRLSHCTLDASFSPTVELLFTFCSLQSWM